jgi:hypothetical protein
MAKDKCSVCECQEKEIKMYFCPKCKSKEVGTVFAFRNAFGIIPRWQCKKCGFENMTFPILVVNPKKVKSSKINKKRRK